MPESERANDPFHWHTGLVTTQMSSMTGRLKTMRAPFLSGEPIDIPSHTLGFATGLGVRDPIGYVLQIVQR